MKRIIISLVGVVMLIAMVLTAVSPLSVVATRSCPPNPPHLEVDKSVSPDPNCGEAQVTLNVIGAGDPAEERQPLDVMLIIDCSASMSYASNPADPWPRPTRLTKAKEAAIAFVNFLDDNPPPSGYDRVGLVSYATSATLNIGLTSDFDAVRDEIDDLAVDLLGYTNIADGIATANTEFLPPPPEGRSDAVWVEILLTDGLPNRWGHSPVHGSGSDFDETAAEYARDFAEDAHDAGITLYTIGLGTSDSPSSGISEYFLDAWSAIARPDYNPGDPAGFPYYDGLAFIGDGHYYHAPTGDQLDLIFIEISEKITTIAATDVVVIEVLPDGVNYADNAVPGEPDEISLDEQTLTWDVGIISINETWTVTFNVTFDNPGYQLVDVFHDTKVTYTDYLGDPASKEFPETHVTVYGNPDCAITADDVVCEDGSGHTASVAGAGVNAIYEWEITGNGMITSTPPYTNSITWDAGVSGTATISVTVTSAYGCECSDSVDVTVNARPTVDITPDGGELTCATTFIILTADTTGSNCTLIAGFKWYKDGSLLGETSDTLIVTGAGTYKVEVECTNGCKAEDSVSVTEDPNRPQVEITPDGGVLDCATTSLNLTASTTGTNCTLIAGFKWYKDGSLLGETSDTLIVTGAGTYKVEVECTNGCKAEDSVSVTEDPNRPQVEITPDGGVLDCATTSLNLTASTTGTNCTLIAGFKWYKDGSLLGETSDTLIVTGAGTYKVEVECTNGCKAEDSVSVTEDPNRPQVEITPDGGVLDCATTSLNLTASTTGTNCTLIAGFKWYKDGSLLGETSDTLIVTGAGTYKVEVECTNGCKAEDSVSVTEDPNRPQVEITPDGGVLDCATTSLNLTASTTGTNCTLIAGFKWYKDGSLLGETSDTLIVTGAGTYKVEVECTNGCKAEDSVSVTEDPNRPQVEITPDGGVLDCATTSLNLTASTTGTNCTLIAGFKWYKDGSLLGETSDTLIVTGAGTYKVEVECTNGCKAEDSVSVTEDPNRPQVEITPDGGVLDCATTSLNLTASTTGTNCTLIAGFKWYKDGSLLGETSDTLIVTGAGTYKVEVECTNGCKAEDSVSVTEDPNRPQVEITPDGGVLDCATTSLNLTASTTGTNCTLIAGFKWYKDGSLLGETSDTLIVTGAGTYKVEVECTNGCKAEDSVSVTEDPNRPQVEITPDGGVLDCATTSLNLTASTTGTNCTLIAGFKWYKDGSLLGETSDTLIVTGAGTYKVEVECTNGCKAEDSVSVTEDPNRPQVEITPDGGVLDCATTSLNLTASTTGTNCTLIAGFKWYKDGSLLGETSDTLIVTGAGTYKVEVECTNGCKAEDSVSVTEDPNRPQVEITPDGGVLDCATTSLNLTASTTGTNCTLIAGFKWYKDGSLLGETSDTLIVTGAGTYKVEVECTNGCKAEDSVSVTEDPNRPQVEITPDGGVLDCATTSLNLTASTTGTNCTLIAGFKWYKDGSLLGETSDTLIVTGAGTYKVEVECTNGCTSYCEVEITVEVCDTCKISGHKYGCDAAGNCTGEGIEGWTIRLLQDDIEIDSTTTDSNGYYEFTNLAPGDYTVTEEPLPSCWESCTPSSVNVTLAAGQNTIVSQSGQTLYWDGDSWEASVLAWVHPNWSSTSYDFSTSGAKWVWESYRVNNPVNGDVVEFKHEFYIPTLPTGGTLHITTDNGYEVYLNGNFVGSAQVYDYDGTDWEVSNLSEHWVNSSGWQSVENYDVSGFLVTGTNVLYMKTANEYMGPGYGDGQQTGTVDSNPAGLIYKLSYDYGCDVNVDFCNRLSLPTCNIACDPEGCAACNGTAVTLTANPSGGTGPYTYLWSTGETTESIDVTASGTYNVTVADDNGCQSTCFKDVTINDNPTCNIACDPEGCAACNGTAVTLTANPSGGTGPYTYLWSTGETTESIDVTASGTYNVTVADDNGCQSTCFKDVTINDNPTCNIACDPEGCAACNGTAVTLTANPSGGTGPYTYLWSTGETTESIDVTASGTYNVTVADDNGCQSTCFKDVTINDNPTCNIACDPEGCAACNGTAVTLTANPSGGTGPYTYLWSTGETTESIDVTASGTYNVTVTDDNGCQSTCFKDVTINDNPTCNIACDPEGCAACNGTAVNLTANPSGGTEPYTYLWSTGETTESIDVTASGTYNVTVTDEHGCSSYCEKEVTVYDKPDCTITAPNNVCEYSTNNTASVADAGVGASYTWAVTGSGTLVSGQNTTAITWDAGGAGIATIGVTITDAHGCTASCSKNVTIDICEVCEAIATNFTICVDTLVDKKLFIDNGTHCIACCDNMTLSYSFDGSTAGVYSYNISCEGRCGQAEATGTVTVLPKPEASFSALPRMGCAPLDVKFINQSTGDPTDWYWDFGDGGTSSLPNPIHTYTTPGTYYVSLTVTNDCGSDTDRDTCVIVVFGVPTAAFNASPTSGCAPLTVNFTDLSTTEGPTSWSWDFGDGTTSTEQNSSHTYSNPGSYNVTLTVTNDCGSDTETGYITAEPCGPVPTTLVLVPESGENPVGTTHNLTATVYDQFNIVMEGVAVTWNITGVGSFSGSPEGVTDADGEADAVITSSEHGISTVTCEVTGNPSVSDIATKEWTYYKPVPTTLELWPETGENLVSTTHNLTATVYDQFGYEMEGVAVTWNITGVGSFSGSPEGVTDGNGEADAVITSSVPGTSMVTCAVTGNPSVSDTATKEWTYIPEATTLELWPETGENLVGTTHNLTATVRDQFNNVMEGVAVTWNITVVGSFSGSPEGVTDSNGEADAVITSSEPGISMVTCEVTGNPSVSDTATKEWTYIPEATTLELWPETGENPVGTTHDLTARVYDQFGYEMEGVAVTWNITVVGSFSGSPEGVTDSNGEADAVITSSEPGISMVTCEVTGNPSVFDTATKEWEVPVATTLELLPESDTNPVNTTHQLTATVRDQFNNVMEGVPLTWNITGVGSFSGSPEGVTDGNGEADAVITSSEPGTSTVTCEVTGNPSVFDTATKEWEVPVATTLELLPESDTNPVNTTHQLTATVRDQFNNVMGGVAVTWNITGVGSFSGSPEGVTDGSGEADAVITSSEPGISTVTCEVTGNPSVFDTATKEWEVPVATTLELLPEYDTNPVNTTHQLTATVRDQFNNVMEGVAVTWNISGVGSFSGSPEGVTDGNGEADAVITSSEPGISMVTCEVTGNPSVFDTATKEWEVPVAMTLELLPETGENLVGTTHDLTATVRDQFNNVMEGVAVTWNITGVGFFSGSPDGITDGSGEADAVITSNEPGISTVTCEVTGNPSVSDTATKEWTLEVLVPATLELTPPSATNVLPGDTSHGFTVTVKDQYGNPMAGQNVSLETTFGTLSVNEVITGVDGTATFTISSDEPETATITATLGDLTDTATKTWTLEVPVPTTLELWPEEDSNAVNTTHALTATVYDQFGYEMAGVPLTWNITGVGIFDGTPDSVTNSAGEASAVITSNVTGISTVRCEVAGNTSVFAIAIKTWTTEGPSPTPGGGGVGVAAPLRYLTVDWDGIITRKPLYSNDRLTQDLLGPSPDGKHSLLLERKTLAPTVNGKRHYLIIIRELELGEIPTLPENTVASVVFNVTPAGAVFDKDIFLALGLNQTQLPENAQNVTMAYYDDINGVWVPLEYEAGGPNGVAELILSAPINHFSIFGLLVELAPTPTPPPPPAHFVPSGLSIATSMEKIWEPVTFVTKIGESVTITANVANDGGQEGTYTVELKLNGETVETKTVTLGTGESQLVRFTVSGLDYGQHEVEVAGLSGEFTTSRTITWWLIIVIIVGIGLISWGVVWGRRRRRAAQEG